MGRKRNKLVRDKIPNILAQKGVSYKIHKANKKEFREKLLEKIVEEAIEVRESQNNDEMVEELADLSEVLMAVYEEYGISCTDVSKTRRKRNKERGGFQNKVVLE